MQHSSTEGFNIYDDAGSGRASTSPRGQQASNKPSRPGSAAAKRNSGGKKSSGRPQSASAGRVVRSSANLNGGGAEAPSAYSSNAGQQPATASAAEASANAYSQLSKESLMLELTQCKQKMRSMELAASQQKAEVQRLENECHKQSTRIEKMLQLDPLSTGKNVQATAEARKELEKSMLVRQLKQQMATLRMQVSEIEAEIESYKQSIKISNLSELTVEREEFYVETQRLKKLVKSLREDLHAERKGRGGDPSLAQMAQGASSSSSSTWGRAAAGSTEAELRLEIARLTAGYQDILAGLALAPSQQHQQQHGTMLDEPSNYFPSNTTFDSPSEKARDLDGEDEGSGLDTPERPGRPHVASSSSAAPSPVAGAAAESASLSPKSAAPQASTSTSTSSSSGTKPRQQLIVQSPSTAPATTPAPAAPAAPAAPSSIHLPGSRVEGKFKDGDRWYPAKVKACNPDGTYHLLYDDGDEEKHTSEDRVKAVPCMSTADAAIALLASTAATSSSTKPISKALAASQVQGKFKAGDHIEALYYNGQTYYPATVQAAIVAPGGAIVYDLLYDDGDREKKVSEDKIRWSAGVEPAVALTEAATAPVLTASVSQPRLARLTNPEDGIAARPTRAKANDEAGGPDFVRLMDTTQLLSHLRVMIREVLRGTGEYNRAFIAMLAASAGSDNGFAARKAKVGSPSVNQADCVAPKALASFAEDMLTEPLSDAQAAAIFEQIDVDGDGCVSQQDFLSFMAGKVRGVVPHSSAPAPSSSSSSSAAAAPEVTPASLRMEEGSLEWGDAEPEDTAFAPGPSISGLGLEGSIASETFGPGPHGLSGGGMLGIGSSAGEVESEGSIGMGLDAGPAREVEGEYENDDFDD